MPDFRPASSNLSPTPFLAPKTDVPLTSSVGQEQQQAVRPHLGVGKEQGTHPSPSLGLIFPTQDLGQFLSLGILKVLLGRQRKMMSKRLHYYPLHKKTVFS